MQAETLFSSASGVHYTPRDIIERARATLEGIDLDPASDEAAQSYIKAREYYVDPYSDDAARGAGHMLDGLKQSWRARTLWLNPPFSIDKRDDSGAIVLNGKDKPIRQRVIDEWVYRWRQAIAPRNGRTEVEAAMLLVPARTDTQWFQPLFGLAMCFVAGRLKFSDADNSAPFPTAIIYAGPQVERFYMLFEEVGVCGKFNR